MRWRTLFAVSVLVATVFAISLVNEEGSGALGFEPDKMVNQDNADVAQDNPDILVDGMDIYIVWQDARNGNWDIFLRSSHDGGLTFGDEVRVDDTSDTETLTDDGSSQTDPRLAVLDNGDLYVFWSDDREGRPLIFYSRSTDGGATFSSDRSVSPHVMGRQTMPAVDISPTGRIMVVWEDTRLSMGKKQIFGSYSDDGSSFSDAERISDTPLSDTCINPQVAFSTTNDVHVVWTEDRLVDMDILISNSVDGGDTFQASYILNRDPSSSDQRQADIDANSTTVVVVWTDTRSTSADIYITISTDRGASFSMEEVAHPNSTNGHQVEPVADIEDNGNISICWTSSPGFADESSDIQMTRLRTNGTYDEVETVNDPGSGITQDNPAVDTARGKAFITWRDFRNNDQADIYRTRTVSSGETGMGPVLSNDRLSPDMGGLGTKFTFQVTYTDAENDPPLPGYPKLDLYYRSAGDQLYRYPGSPFNMTHKVDQNYNMDYRDGENYILTVKPGRELELFHSFRARAASGNLTEVSTDLVQGPLLDFSGPEFSSITPKERKWTGNNIVSFRMNITDDIAGVDPWSTFYQRYNLATMSWDSWQRKGNVEIIDNHTVSYSVNITLFEGDENKVRFRARDTAGNGNDEDGYSVSRVQHIWVDPSGPFIEIRSPDRGDRLSDTDVRVTADLWDLGAGLDPSSINVSYSLGGPDNYGDWVPLDQLDGKVQEDPDEEGMFMMEANLSMTFGFNNFFRVRALDVLGNSRTTEGHQVVIIRQKEEGPEDRPPAPVSSIQPKVSGSVRPHITWTPTSDPDGDLVSYWIRITESDSGDPVLDWTDLGPGVTYWDIDEESSLSPSGNYIVEVKPRANGLNGTSTESELRISPDANMPPESVSGFKPRATSDPTPVLSWGPSRDPEGEEVIYFIRVGTFRNGGDVVDWTSTYTDRKYRIDNVLGAGMYHIQLMATDGRDFSTISHFTMSIGIYSPELESERTSIVIYPPEDETEGQIDMKTEKVDLEVFNKGFTFDNIDIILEGEATRRDDMEVYTQDTYLEISPGSSMNTTLMIVIGENTELGLYSLNVTVLSLDGVSSYTRSFSIRIVDPDEIDLAPGDEDEGEEGIDDTELLLWLFFALLLVIVLAMGYAFYRIDRSQREENVEIMKEGDSKRTLSGGKRKRIGVSGREKPELPSSSDDEKP